MKENQTHPPNGSTAPTNELRLKRCESGEDADVLLLSYPRFLSLAYWNPFDGLSSRKVSTQNPEKRGDVSESFKTESTTRKCVSPRETENGCIPDLSKQ